MISAIFNVIRIVLGLVLARLSARRDHTATARRQVVLVMGIAEACVARIAARRLRRYSSLYPVPRVDTAGDDRRLAFFYARSAAVAGRSPSCWTCSATVDLTGCSRGTGVLCVTFRCNVVHGRRSVGESVEISRPADFKTDANSGSSANSRRSLTPGSLVVGSRTAHTKPSPLLRPVRIRSAIVGSASQISRRT